jgi:predicted O-methyltransferase YrrM
VNRPIADAQPPWAEVAARAKGFMPEPEGMALYRAGLGAGRTGLGALLEIGTYCGKSAVYLGAAARETGTVLFSIDHHRGSEELQPGWPHHDPEVLDPATATIETLPWARRTVREAGLEGHVVLVVGDSPTVARYWAAPLGLVFIDGGHGAEVARADFSAWVPKVATGGILAIHDVFPDPAHGGQVPYQLYREVLQMGEFSVAGHEGSLRLLERTTAATTDPLGAGAGPT